VQTPAAALGGLTPVAGLQVPAALQRSLLRSYPALRLRALEALAFLKSIQVWFLHLLDGRGKPFHVSSPAAAELIGPYELADKSRQAPARPKGFVDIGRLPCRGRRISANGMRLELVSPRMRQAQVAYAVWRASKRLPDGSARLSVRSVRWTSIPEDNARASMAFSPPGLATTKLTWCSPARSGSRAGAPRLSHEFRPMW